MYFFLIVGFVMDLEYRNWKLKHVNYYVVLFQSGRKCFHLLWSNN